jgi:hypothetical protein
MEPVACLQKLMGCQSAFYYSIQCIRLENKLSLLSFVHIVLTQSFVQYTVLQEEGKGGNNCVMAMESRSPLWWRHALVAVSMNYISKGQGKALGYIYFCELCSYIYRYSYLNFNPNLHCFIAITKATACG